MKIYPLTVGPIVGATTGKTVRIWGRGNLEFVDGRPRRAIGVARLRPAGTNRFRPSHFFRLNPNFDLTGLAIFADLDPERQYEYQIGWFFSDKEVEALDTSVALDWTQIERYTFCTAATDTSQARSFVFGSCRYLLRFLGGGWFDDRGDKTFRSILAQIDSGRRTDALLMLGDQIYADDMLFVGLDDTINEFFKRYRLVFSQPYIRQLMARLPTYMMLDDHEIEDGWPARATPADHVTKYPAAMHAFFTYQVSHSPLFRLNEAGRLAEVPNKIWYTFHDGCCDFFVGDTRTERYLHDEPEERELINSEQMTALETWLNDGSGRVKFVATSVPFFPDNRSGSPDAWGGFLKQRTHLLDFIRRHQIRRVVFLAGDVHSSMSAEVVCPIDPAFKVISLISSPFFWPYPHSRPSEFRLSGTLRTWPFNENYLLQNGGPVYNTDNFTRVTVDLDGLQAEVFDRKGVLLGEKVHRF